MKHLEDVLLIAAFIVPFLLSISIFIEARNSLPQKVMAVALFNAFFVFLANYFYFKNLTLSYIPLHSLHIASVLWLFPSIYLYAKAIVSSIQQFNKELWHILPGLIFGLVSAVLFYGLLNQEERIYYLTSYRSGVEFTTLKLKLIYLFRMVDVAFIVFQVVFYTWQMMRMPVKFHKQLKQEYSNIENFSISWLRWFNGAFVLIGLLCILFYVFNPLDDTNDLFLVFFLFSISVFMWVLGIWSFKQQKPSVEVALVTEPNAKELSEGKTREKELTEKLMAYFENEKPYLKPDLNLTTVCKNIGTNRTYLSNLINANFEMNFNAFVNHYRVNHVLSYQKQNAGASNQELATEGGFGSVSSLKRAMANSSLKKAVNNEM